MKLSVRTNWLRAYAHFVADPNHRSTLACPSCGQKKYAIRNIANPQTRLGYALFWCESCLNGIKFTPAKAPDDVRVWPIDDPESLAGVPAFTHVDPPASQVP